VPAQGIANVAYRLLAGFTGAFGVLLGAVFVVAFLDRAVFQVFAHPLFDTDIGGYFVVGFAGCVLFGWAGCLFASARRPYENPGIATATATAFIVLALLRLLGWYSGEFWLIREQLRLEAAVLAVAALGFIWLKPERLPA
jgi:hypothetical protein